jgi:membrane-associated phospholipid phosphatase
LLLAGFLPVAAAAEDEGQPWVGQRLAIDTWHVATAPTRWDGGDWLVAGVCVAGTTAIGVFLDGPVEQYCQDHLTPSRTDAAHKIAQLGTVASLGSLGVAGLHGWATGDRRGIDCLVDGIEASIITSVFVVPVTKYVIGRSRPNASGSDSDTYQPFSRDASFPSGHTAQAFTVAAVMSASYENSPWIAVPSYLLAAAVGVSRVIEDEHYLSDVVAGAIIGTAIGTFVVRANHGRRRSAWMPERVAVDVSGRSLTLGWSF